MLSNKKRVEDNFEKEMIEKKMGKEEEGPVPGRPTLFTWWTEPRTKGMPKLTQHFKPHPMWVPQHDFPFCTNIFKKIELH